MASSAASPKLSFSDVNRNKSETDNTKFLFFFEFD